MTAAELPSIMRRHALADERTVQYERIADAPIGVELERLQELYFASFPTVASDGPGRLSPTCARGRAGSGT